MVTKRFGFLGVLANVDDSIVKVRLRHDLKIEALSQDEGVGLVGRLEERSQHDTQTLLFMQVPCLNVKEKKLYVVRGSFDADSNDAYDGGKWPLFPALIQFQNQIVDKYLQSTLRLMRLFKDGNVCMPLHYVLDDSEAIMRLAANRYVSRESYSLADSELDDLDAFLSDTRLPLPFSFLELALQNFELHYEIANLNLRFLSLMIGLETLFNPGGGEVRYRVSRNAAVLLGKDGEDARSIYSEIKRFYDKRSVLVHTGDSDISRDDLEKLRSYVRESIKLISKTYLSKDQIIELLNESAFGKLREMG